jgi:hypothetical protein
VIALTSFYPHNVTVVLGIVMRMLCLSVIFLSESCSLRMEGQILMKCFLLIFIRAAFEEILVVTCRLLLKCRFL